MHAAQTFTLPHEKWKIGLTVPKTQTMENSAEPAAAAATATRTTTTTITAAATSINQQQSIPPNFQPHPPPPHCCLCGMPQNASAQVVCRKIDLKFINYEHLLQQIEILRCPRVDIFI